MALNDMWSTVDPGATYDTSNAEVAPTKIASVGSQWEQMVYGSFRDHKQDIDQALQTIGQQAGLPADFDWNPYLEQAARTYIQQSGKVWDERYVSNAAPVHAVVQAAVAQNPQLQAILPQIGPGSQFWQEGEAQRQGLAEHSKQGGISNNIKLLSVLAGPLAAAYLAPAGGASATAGFGEAAYTGGGAAATNAGLVGGTAAGANGVTVGSYSGPASAGSPTVTGTATGSGQFVNAAGQALPAMGAATPALAGGTTAGGTFTPAAQGATTGVGTGLGTAATGATLADQILGPSGNASATQGDYQIPWADIFKGVVGMYGANQAQNNAEGLLDKIINSDQWRTQAPRYYEPIYDAATKGIGDTAYGQSIAEQSARQSAAKGYNMSGNMITDIAKSLNTGSMDYVKTLTPLATGRGETTGANSGITSGILNSGVQGTNAMGGILESIYRGQQPTAAQQTQGTSTNQNFLQSLQGI